jgi:hypothetical protein
MVSISVIKRCSYYNLELRSVRIYYSFVKKTGDFNGNFYREQFNTLISFNTSL